MAQLHLRTGDIFTTTADGIGHGVNCAGVMGSGIAVQFRSRFPGMYEPYRALCATGGLVPGECHVYRANPAGSSQSWVFNIASQRLPGPDATLEWLTAGVRAALVAAERRSVQVLALPQIGCGIGGLNWADARPVLADLAEQSPVGIEAWTFG
jgi:O-acetyl-ADP-ribose deacetylase (regulator of RNase III)